MSGSALACLRAADTCVLIALDGPLLPRVLHWGADLPEADDPETLQEALGPPVPPSALDEPWPLTVMPLESDGWSGHPGLQVHESGSDPVLRLRLSGPPEVVHDPAGGGRVTARAVGASTTVAVTVAWQMDRHGVVRVSQRVDYSGSGVLDMVALRTLAPLPTAAAEVLDLTGRWSRERSPQRSPLQHGTRMRASRRGRTGHDATGLICAGTAGFGFGHGQVWGAHLAWSGDSEHLVESLPEGAGGHASVIGAGELLRPGELRLRTGERYDAPEVVLAWSGEGLDGLAHRLHETLRDRPQHPSGHRPLVLNTWEAVYFDTDTDRLLHLAEVAGKIGVERFVLDDGWFGDRRDDTKGLGDWVVSDDVWPGGLHPLVERVRSLGMQFGLWVEPEMVNPDSDLARAHPDWVFGASDGSATSWRHQRALDLSLPEVTAYLLERLDALVSEYAVDFLKWDHNRDLHSAVTQAAGAPGAPSVHAQTTALYALLDELRRRHPSLEIESCASGGARVDLGIIERTDRVWTSDCNDALERQQIQRWTNQLLPPELIGSHVGPAKAHTTGRTLDLSFRLLTALFGHAGLEWDVTSCTPAELEVLRAWAALYRELRPLLHTGRVVRADLPDDELLVHGVHRADRSEAVLAVVRLRTGPAATPGQIPLPGLDPQLSYRVRVREELGGTGAVQIGPPGWWHRRERGFVLSGAALGTLGLTMPVLCPAQGLLLHLTAEPSQLSPADP